MIGAFISLMILLVRAMIYAAYWGLVFTVWFVRDVLIPAAIATALVICDGWHAVRKARSAKEILESRELSPSARATLRRRAGLNGTNC